MKNKVGGQAVLEGVMMKAGRDYATAVRLEDGSIKVKKDKLRFKESKIPFIRGIINLIVILHIGIKTLNWSAAQATGEEESSTFWSVAAILLGVVFALFLFKFIPLSVANLVPTTNNFLFNVVDGVVKIGIFILYLYAISRFKDIQRVFEYHGAEHKVVNCYESGKKVNVNNVKKFSRIHKRCGTTFVFLVLFISIFVYLFIPSYFSFWSKFGLRILLLPVIASISYELLMFAAKSSRLFNTLMYPGLIVQKVSTGEPSDDQIEVAIKALEKAVGEK